RGALAGEKEERERGHQPAGAEAELPRRAGTEDLIEEIEAPAEGTEREGFEHDVRKAGDPGREEHPPPQPLPPERGHEHELQKKQELDRPKPGVFKGEGLKRRGCKLLIHRIVREPLDGEEAVVDRVPGEQYERAEADDRPPIAPAPAQRATA